MAWFEKKPKNLPIVSVIKYEGPNDVLIWRYPHEDFNTNSQLIVGPGQEANFVKGGKVWDKLPSGTHTLNTENYPFIRSLIGLVTRGVSPFSCVVYFVNKTVSMAAPWGTDSPISVVDVTGVTQQQRWAHEMGMQIVKNPGTTVNAIGGVQPVVGMPGMVGVAGSPMTTINTKNTEATSMPELLDVDSRIEQRLQQLRGELTNPEADAMASVRALSVLIKERNMTAAAFKG